MFAADIISTVEFNHTGELLATGDKGGRVVIFQQEIEVQLPVRQLSAPSAAFVVKPDGRHLTLSAQNKNQPQFRSEYNVYSTFQSHEPEFDYLKSLEIEEKINKIRWLPQKNAAQFLLSTNGEFCVHLGNGCNKHILYFRLGQGKYSTTL